MPSPPCPLPGAALLVPVKAFADAKGRLAPVLDPGRRAALARHLASIVVTSAAGLPVFVVCDDPAVSAWATSAGAGVVWRPGRGLDQAVRDGVEALRADGFTRVVVAHSDLPLARSLAWVAAFPGVTIVPDRRDDGTNAIAVPATVGFRFAYGAGSFHRHAAEARRLGLPLRVVRDRAIGFDVDVPDDLAEAVAADAGLAAWYAATTVGRPVASGQV